jgi:hypothetical protein
MPRCVVVGLILLTCVSVPAMAAAQAEEQDLANLPVLNVRMTAPAGGLWHTPVRKVAPTRGSLLPALYVSLIGLEAYDGYSTTRGLKQGATESNRFLSRLAGNPSALWAVKGGAAFASIYLAERLWRKGHRGQAIAAMLLSNGFMAAVARSNASVLRSQP